MASYNFFFTKFKFVKTQKIDNKIIKVNTSNSPNVLPLQFSWLKMIDSLKTYPATLRSCMGLVFGNNR